jgi:hypothetical protein
MKDTYTLNEDNRKAWAEILYTRKNYSIDMIVATVPEERSKIEAWAIEDQWEKMRLSLLTCQREQLESLYRILGKISAKIINDIENLTHADADLLLKYTRAIKNLQTKKSVSDVLDGFDLYVLWLQKADLDLAKLVAPTYEAFITDYMKKADSVALLQ